MSCRRFDAGKTEEVGFEPTDGGYPSPVFKTGAFDHSATPPARGFCIVTSLVAGQQTGQSRWLRPIERAAAGIYDAPFPCFASSRSSSVTSCVTAGEVC